ncbi:DUF11 domain-containing protein [Corynebacterium choanae]|uniref:Translocon-associated protein beta (TRAPB) n=1 Tax=Corynebacterium choanae TaxID=1862358 RepID=A0A3G6J972_9CORY|nr:DUF11 domain-containing protein [Corynebacterium choanae]AZA14617.1 Translocon-associated protein beta (TRAPB) [Corynebacterium choanae]
MAVLLAQLCAIMLVTVGLQVTVAPARAAEPAATPIGTISGVTVTPPVETTAAVGTSISYTFNLNCQQSCNGISITMPRPAAAWPKGAVTAAPPGASITTPTGEQSTITFPKLGETGNGVYSVTVSWPTKDPFSYPSKQDVPFTVALNGQTATGTVPTTITGSPSYTFRKSASVNQAVHGQYITYVAEYFRYSGEGVTGSLGVIKDQLPAGLEFVKFLNTDPTPGGQATFNDIVDDYANGFLKAVNNRDERLISRDYLRYDAETRTIQLTVDKTVDAAAQRVQVLRIKYVARVTEEAVVNQNLDNSFGWRNEGLTDLGGNPVTNTVKDAVKSIRVIEAGAGSVGKSPVGTQLNHRDKQTFNFSVLRYGNGPITISDRLRPQGCLQYPNAVYQEPGKEQPCSVAGGDGKVHYVPQEFLLEPVTIYQGSGDDFQVVQGHPAAKITLVNAAGQTHELPEVPADTDTDRKRIALTAPAGFIPVGFTAVLTGVPSGERQVGYITGRIDIPDRLFEKPDGSRLENINLINDIRFDYADLGNKPIVRTAAARMTVYENFANPGITLETKVEKYISDEQPAKVRFTLKNDSDEPYQPTGYIVMPNGWEIHPDKVFAAYNNPVCNRGVTVGEGQTVYQPNMLRWERLAQRSPSGGEIWKYSAPEGVVVPGKASVNGCQVDLDVFAAGAPAGKYTDPVLDNEFPAIEAMVTAADPEQPLAATPAFATNPYGIGCRPDEQSCRDMKRWRTSTATVSVDPFVAAEINKYAWGDKDPSLDTRTTALPADDQLATTSWATKDVTFFLRVGTSGSVPLKDYVLYDALPAAGPWTAMNSLQLSQETTAGTHTTYDPATGEVTGSEVNNNTLVPTLTGPIVLPDVSYYDKTLRRWKIGPVPAKIYYSAATDPCRPEMGATRAGAYPTDRPACATFNGENEWKTADQVSDWASIRYLRIEFLTQLTGQFDIPVPMKMPENDTTGTGIGDSDIAINRVAFRAANPNGDVDLGTLPPAVARVKYVPELEVNKSLILPDTGGSFGDARRELDGTDPGDYLIGVGDYVLFQISVTGKNDGVVLESPMIRDFIPAGLKFVDVLENETTGHVYTSYADPVADEAAAAVENPVLPTNPTSKVVWFPGLLTDDGVIDPNNPNAPHKPAKVTMRLQVTGDNIGVIQNFAFGTTREQVNIPTQDSCNQQNAQAIADGATQNNCDSQTITIAPSIRGSLFDLGTTPGDGLTETTPRVTKLPAGAVVAQLLDETGQPVLIDGKPVTVDVDEEGNYVFPKVYPGREYQVALTVSDTYQETFAQRFQFMPAESSSDDSDISEPHHIDGGIDTTSSTPRAVTGVFTVPGTAGVGSANVVNVDFAVKANIVDLTLVKSANETEPRNVGDTASFTISGANTGNVPLSNVHLTDEWATSHQVTPLCTITNQAGQTVTDQRGDLLSDPGAILQPGDNYACEVRYQVTQADLDQQLPLRNEAKITGEYAGKTVEKTDSASIDVHTAAPAFTVTKTVELPVEKSAQLHVGDEVLFVIEVANTGNVTLTNVAVADQFSYESQPTNLVCGLDRSKLTVDDATKQAIVIPAIPPQVTYTCLGKFVADQEFLENQSQEVNVATVIPNYSTRNEDNELVEVPMAPKSDEVRLQPVAANPQLQVTKEVRTDDGSYANTRQGTLDNGGQLTFRLTVRNTGDVQVQRITLTDTLTGRAHSENLEVGICTDENNQVVAGNGSIALRAGQAVTCEVTMHYTQQDVDQQQTLTNQVTVTGVAKSIDDNGKPVQVEVTESDDQLADNTVTITPPAASPALQLDKTSDKPADTLLLAGDEVTYTFRIENTGNVTINDVRLEEDLAGVKLTCPDDVKTLSPGAVATCSGTYTVTADDVARDDQSAKPLSNTARVHGHDPQHQPVVSNDSSTSIETGAPRLAIVKEARGYDGADIDNLQAGDAVVYQITVTNNGTAPLFHVHVNDDTLRLWGAKNLPCYVGDNLEDQFDGFSPEGIPALGVGEYARCVALVQIPQEDIDESLPIVNTASAEGEDARGNRSNVPSFSATVETSEAASMTLQKTSDAPEYMVQGDTVVYTFVFTNTGDVTLKQVTLHDDMLAQRGIDVASATGFCAPFDLPPGQTHTCYSPPVTIDARDIAGRELLNQAAFTSLKPSGNFTNTDPVTGESNIVADKLVVPRIELVKSIVDEPADGYGVGDTVTFAIVATNAGLTPLTGVKLRDPVAAQRSAAETPSASAIDCGDRPEFVGVDGGTLAVDESVRCTVTMQVTQADVDDGNGLLNNAYATGDTRQASARAAAEVTAPLKRETSLLLEKSIDNEQPIYQAGDTVNYRFVLTNTGQLTVHDITISDDMLADAGVDIVCPQQVTKPGLGAGEHAECSATYTVTAKDAATASTPNTIRNIASADGVAADGLPVSAPQVAADFVSGTPNLVVAKTAKIVSGGVTGDDEQTRVVAGSTVEWTVTVTNTGNAPADNVTLNDAMFAAPNTVVCTPVTATGAPGNADTTVQTPPGEPATLAPDALGSMPAGSAVQCVVTTTITQDDVDAANTTVNTATASRSVANPGADDAPTVTTGEVTAKVPNALAAGISLTKEVTAATKKEQYVAGDRIVYSFTVTNTGQVTLSDISITDPLLAGLQITCPVTTLAPDASTTCLAEPYIVTDSDATRDAGQLLNEASVTGVAPAGRDNLSGVDDNNTVTANDEVTVTVGAPKLVLKKLAQPTTQLAADAEVTYTLTATNAGNTPLEEVTITDPWFAADQLSCTGPSGEPISDIAAGVQLPQPGDSITCYATKTISQKEVDAGLPLTNTATATGYSNGVPTSTTDPDDANDRVQVTDTAQVTVSPTTAAALTLEKQAAPEGILTTGDQVMYTFTVRNTGSVTVHDVAIVDQQLDGIAITCEKDVLAPGESTPCAAAAPYVITSTDAANGSVENTATVTGLKPDQTADTPLAERPSANASVTVDTGLPRLQVKKTALAESAQVGDSVKFALEVTNIGTTPVEHIGVVDKLAAERGAKVNCDDPAIAAGEKTLAPQAMFQCTVSVEVNTADLAEKELINIAEVTGSYHQQKTPEATSTATVTVQARDAALATKIFIDNTTQGEQSSSGDGQTADTAVTVPYGTQATATVTVTNSGAAPLVGVGITIDGYPAASLTNLPVTITDDAGNTVDNLHPVDGIEGLVIRQAESGYVLSADATLPAVVLPSGATATVEVLLPAQTAKEASYPVDASAINAETNQPVTTAHDPLYTVAATTPQLAGKIFGDSVTTDDGQSPATAVAVPAGKPFPAAITVTNTGTSPLTAITIAVDGALADSLTLTMTDAAGNPLAGKDIPTSAKPVDGVVLRFSNGQLVLSADKSLPAVLLPPGATITGSVTVAASQIGKNTQQTVTAVDAITGTQVQSVDDFYTTAESTPPPATNPALSAKIFVDEPTTATAGRGDGDTVEQAVVVPQQATPTATMIITNTGDEPIGSLALTLPETDTTAPVFTLKIAGGELVSTPTTATGVEGNVLRQQPDGSLILSSDSALPAVVLQPGQELQASIVLPEQAAGVRDYPLAVSGEGTSSATQVTDTDSLYVRGAGDAQLVTKLYVGDTLPGADHNVDPAVDGQTSATAVPVLAGSPVTISAAMTNTASEPLTHLYPSTTGPVTLDDATWQLVDEDGNAVAPDTGEHADGLMLRVTRDGTVVLSDDATLDPVVLQPGQTIVATTTVTITGTESVESMITVTGVTPDGSTPVIASDPLWLVAAEQPVDPTDPPVDPTDPPVDPTDPTDPPVDPTDPPVDPTDPPVDPTDPPVDPTDPPVDPTDPAPEPPQPVAPGSSSSEVPWWIIVVPGVIVTVPILGGLINSGLLPPVTSTPGPVTPPEPPVSEVQTPQQPQPVQPEPPRDGLLARTGADVDQLGLVALLLLLLGGGLLVLRRRSA